MRETYYGSCSVMPGGVPNTDIVRNVPRLPNSLAKYWGGQSIWTHPYEPQLAHSHQQHSPTQATTQDFLVFIRHPEPQLKWRHSKPQVKEFHVFNSYPKQQLKGYVPRHNSRNTPTSPPLRYHQSLVDHTHKKINNHSATTLSPSVALEPPGEICFQTAWQDTSIARRQVPLMPLTYKYRLAL